MDRLSYGHLINIEVLSLIHLMEQMKFEELMLVNREQGQHFYDNESGEHIDFREGLKRISERMEKPLEEYSIPKEEKKILENMFHSKSVPIVRTVDKTEKEKAEGYRSIDRKDFTGHEYENEEEEVER